MPYYKSEFSLLLELTDRDGNDIGVPAVDWRASFCTGRYPHYVASSIGGKLRNCVIDGNHIRVLFNRHGLGPGRLQCEFTCILPDDRYPDGTQDVVKLKPLDVMLTADINDCPCDITAKMELPAIYVNTEATIAELTAAAQACNSIDFICTDGTRIVMPVPAGIPVYGEGYGSYDGGEYVIGEWDL